ncbi:MAG: NUDIX hydrolase [Rhodocyclaceae bacterium]
MVRSEVSIPSGDHLDEIGIASEQLLNGYMLKAWRDEVKLPDGSESVREYIRHPGACVVIAELRPGVFVMERQFRYPIGRPMVEFPAGKLDPDETELACAQRELLEETGYRADRWEHIATLHPCIAYSSERIEVFLAQDLHFEGQRLDPGEFLDVFEMTLEDAEQAVLEGLITDAKTISCLFWARKILQRGRA